MYKILKEVKVKGSSKTKVNKYDNTKDVVLTYVSLKEYYHIYGYNCVYVKSQQVRIFSLEFHYN